MSGYQFLETLHQIGYPKAGEFAAKNFDWLFEDADTLPFLSWFCNNVGPQNVLRVEEKVEFSRLEQSGVEVLDGPILMKTLETLPIKHNDVSIKELQEEVLHLSEDLEQLEKKNGKCLMLKRTLSLHVSGLTNRLSRLRGMVSVKEKQYQQSLQLSCVRSDEFNATLHRVYQRVQHVCSLYGRDEVLDLTAATNSQPVFFSQLCVEEFHKAEESFCRELAALTKKLFFEGIGEVIGGELSRYQLLEVSDPSSLLIKGSSEASIRLDCEELARLQTVFPKSEGDRLNAIVESRCCEVVSNTAESILCSLHTGNFPSDANKLKVELDDVGRRLVMKQQELRTLTESELPILIRELGSMQTNTVLTGDYRLKIARQNYFSSNQDKVIKLLMAQKARYEFLTMTYDIEARFHREIHHLLTTLLQTMADKQDGFYKRMKAMLDPRLSPEHYDRSTVSTRDVSTARLHCLLDQSDDGKADQELFLTYSRLQNSAEELTRGHRQAKVASDMVIQSYDSEVQAIEKEVEKCEATLYSESSTMKGLPMMTPSALRDATSELDCLLTKLQAIVIDIISSIDGKRKALRNDVLLNKERELFVNFHINPDRLRWMVESLESRVMAEHVK